VTLSPFTFLWCLEKGKENSVEEKVEEREEWKNLPRVALLAQVFASVLTSDNIRSEAFLLNHPSVTS